MHKRLEVKQYLAKSKMRVSPPLACIFGTFCLYFTCIPPVSHRILGLSRVSLYQSISIHFCSRSTVPRCIPLYPAVSVHI